MQGSRPAIGAAREGRLTALALLLVGSFLLPAAALRGQVPADIKARLSVQVPKDPQLAKARIDSVFLASQTVLWGTSAGLFVERPDGTGTWWNAKNAPFKLEEFVAVAARAPGEIWVAVRNPAAGQGVFQFDGQKWQRFHPSLNEMLSDLANCLLVDGKNRLWIGYEERGIDRFVGEGYGTKTLRLFSSLKVKDGLLQGSVNGLAESGGRLWIASTGGLCRFNPDGGHKVEFESWVYGRTFPDQAVWAVVPFADGKVVCGTDQGFVVPDGQGWKLVGMKDGLSTVPVKALCIEKNRIWVGHTNGLQVYENGRLSPLLYTPDLLPAQSIRCLAAHPKLDGTTRLYVGTEAGARVFILR